jgi:hypothetical protein
VQGVVISMEPQRNNYSNKSENQYIRKYDGLVSLEIVA